MLELWQENIFRAIITQDTEKLKSILIEFKNKELNFTDEDGNTPLHFASDLKNERATRIVRYLLQKGCEPNVVNAHFETPFDRAYQNKNEATMNVLKEFIDNQQIQYQDDLDSMTDEEVLYWEE